MSWSVRASDPRYAYRAFRWVNGVIEDLGDLPFSFDVAANGVNNPGEIVGVTGLLGDQVGAFLWSNGVMDTIYSLPEYNFSKANAINDSGLIVGSAHTWEYENLPTLAYLWNSGTFHRSGNPPRNHRKLGVGYQQCRPGSRAFGWR